MIEDDGRSTAKKVDVVLVPQQAEQLAYKLVTGLAADASEKLPLLNHALPRLKYAPASFGLISIALL